MTSTPARSWSRMASWVASSNVSLTSVWPYSPALILSSAVQNHPGKPWLPITCVGIGGSAAVTGSSLSEGQPLGNDLAHDLRRAGGDRPQAHVAEEPLDGELAHVAVATVQLHRVVGNPVRDFGGQELGHRDLPHALLAGGVKPGGVIDELPGRLEVGRELGDATAQSLARRQ